MMQRLSPLNETLLRGGAPDRAGGCVAVAPEGVFGWPHALLRQAQLLLYRLKHTLATWHIHPQQSLNTRGFNFLEPTGGFQVDTLG